jgi:hypothetical protein
MKVLLVMSSGIQEKKEKNAPHNGASEELTYSSGEYYVTNPFPKYHIPSKVINILKDRAYN